ncbi:MAG: hypothetical protein LBE12_13125 [Planctomycetaceae bacterium]|jgi:tetratricopeptide (TPR) repeat protein|nr:hypothetical protein [Planctomycetaceae bacterium]
MSKQILRTIFFQEIPYTKWLTRGIIVFIPFFLCYCLLPQHSIFRSGDWWQIRMEQGNFQSAVYWANCIIRRTPDGDYGYECRAAAYELGGKYEKALDDYRMAESFTNKYYPSPHYIHMARVYYKKNDTNK